MVSISNKRADSIDLLRGWAMLAMILANFEPFGSLPAWMYHAQSPPPGHTFNPEWPGITWVDLIFPFFIFSMGAAVPFSLSRKLDSGLSIIKTNFSIIQRGLTLLAFAIFAAHARPHSLDVSERAADWIGPLLFGVMFMIWGRFPWKLSGKILLALRWAGLAIALSIFIIAGHKDGAAFSLFRSDIILKVLSTVLVFGSIIWVISRYNITYRIVLLLLLLAIRLGYSVESGWLYQLGSQTEISVWSNFVKSVIPAESDKHFSWIYNFRWLFQWQFLKYLFIFIPATIVGDRIREWTIDKTDCVKFGWGKLRNFAIVILMVSVIISTLICLQGRWVSVLVGLSVVMALAGFMLLNKPQKPDEKMLRYLFNWGMAWYIAGLIFEPYEGGIKKDPSTMSYYFITSALATFAIIGVTILTSRFRLKKGLNFVMLVGQNPMFAYMTSSNILLPLLHITGLMVYYNKICAKSPWGGFVTALILVILVGLGISTLTRKKIYLRT